ncbi:MAG: hypothetical protein U5L96_10075 [Owenweeksia sp.]|nr:hypothetical protein [Owenweeksia sp.]
MGSSRGQLDQKGLQGVEGIINLAGATLNHRWTPAYKSLILRSRVDSTRLLFNAIQEANTPLKTLISASAVGYYPHDYHKLYTENNPPGNDFLSMVNSKVGKGSAKL